MSLFSQWFLSYHYADILYVCPDSWLRFHVTEETAFLLGSLERMNSVESTQI